MHEHNDAHGVDLILGLLLAPRPAAPGHRYATADAIAAQRHRAEAEMKLCDLLLAVEAYRLHTRDGLDQGAIGHRIHRSKAWVCQAIKRVKSSGRDQLVRALSEHGKHLNAAQRDPAPLERAKTRDQARLLAEAMDRLLADVPPPAARRDPAPASLPAA